MVRSPKEAGKHGVRRNTASNLHLILEASKRNVCSSCSPFCCQGAVRQHGGPGERLSSAEPCVPSHHLSNPLPARAGFCARFRGLREGWSWWVSGQSPRLRNWFAPLPWLASGCELKWREGGWQKVVWGNRFPCRLGQLSSTCQLS